MSCQQGDYLRMRWYVATKDRDKCKSDYIMHRGSCPQCNIEMEQLTRQAESSVMPEMVEE